MSHNIVFIPGLILTKNLFLAQEEVLKSRPNLTITHANTLDHASITDMAEEILDTQDGNFIPIGLSMGGYVAAELARLVPERLDGMALLSTGPHADDERQKRIRRELVRMSAMGKFKGVTPRLLPRFLSPAALKNETLSSAVMAMGEAVGQHNFALQQQAIMYRHDQMDTLAQFQKPSLVLCGDLDELTPPELAYQMADVLTDVELVILPNVGHLSAMEAPDEVTAALLRLLGRIGSSALSS